MRAFNAAPPGVRAFGPIPIVGGPESFGAPIGRIRPGTAVDLGPYRGTPIPMARAAIQRLSGLNQHVVELLEREGALSPSDAPNDKGGVHLLFDPAWTAIEVHDAWAARQPMPIGHADFPVFDAMRRQCQVPDGHPYPEQVLEGMFQRLLEIGNFGRHEVGVFLSLNEARWKAVKAWLDARLGRFCAVREHAGRVTLEMLRLSLPTVLRTAPRTCFEPLPRAATDAGACDAAVAAASTPADADAREDDGDEGEFRFCGSSGPADTKINAGREAPSAAARATLWGMDELRLTATLYALFMAPALRRAKALCGHVNVMAKMEAIMREHAPCGGWTSQDYAAAFRAYAIDKTILPADTPATRYRTVRMFRILVARVHMYLGRRSPQFAAEVRPLVAPALRLPIPFRRELKQLYGHLKVAGQEARKRTSHKAMDELDQIVDATRNRRDEMRALGGAVRLESDAFEPGERERVVGVELPVLDGRGALAGGTQKVWLRVWRCETALEDLDRVPSEQGQARARGLRRTDTLPPAAAGFIAEHIDTIPVGRSVSREPWMLELDRLGVTGQFGRASPERKEARHRAIVDHGLPGSRHTAAGTLNFDCRRAHIRRYGLEVGRHFAPIEQAEYGIRLAYHSLDCVNQSYNRLHEVRQQTRGGFRRIDLPPELAVPDAEPWFRQDVIGKVPRWRDLAEMLPVPLAIRQTSRMEAIALTELHKRHAGLRVFPTMAAAYDFKWKCAPAQYVISSFGRTLNMGELHVLLEYLLVGWDDYGFQDFRHAEAEDAAFDGYSTKLIAFLLGQADIDNALYYSQLDDWARAIVDQERLRRREEAQDRRLGDWIAP